ncbi:MAG: nitroreductase family protein [Marinobacter sp.]|nr:nitroreductase family protein [Marinobacter sp.]
MSDPNRPFTDEERAGLYRAIFERRDVRSQFLPDPIPRPVLARLLKAAHHAPSVGFMQPWDFILIDSLDVREQVLASYHEENAKAANNYSGDQQETYRSLKLQGIVESPLKSLHYLRSQPWWHPCAGAQFHCGDGLVQHLPGGTELMAGGAGGRHRRRLGEHCRSNHTGRHSEPAG